jgi:hypothetical protein
MVYKPKTGEETLKEPPLNLERSAITPSSSWTPKAEGTSMRHNGFSENSKNAVLNPSKHIMTPRWTYSCLAEHFLAFHLLSRPHEPVPPLFVPL